MRRYLTAIVAALAILLAGAPASAQSAPTRHPGKVRIVSTAADALCVGVGTVSPASSACTGGIYAGPIVVNGLLTVSGFGIHPFSTGGTGGNILRVENTTDGTGNYAQFIAAAGTTALSVLAFPQSFTTSTWSVAGGAAIEVGSAGGISIAATHASGTVRFYTGAATLRWTITATGALNNGAQIVDTTGYYSGAWPTTASAANAYVVDGGYVTRSTSSLRYKTDIERIGLGAAQRVVEALRPITYRGIHDGLTRFAGFAAEEVAALDPMLVTLDKQGRPDYVMYDRIPAYLVLVVQDHDRRLTELDARLKALEAIR